MTHRTLLLVLLLAAAAGAQTPLPEDPLTLLREGENQQQALQVNEAIYQAIGFGNTFLVTTREGNVIIDTSSALPARRHLKLLKAVSAGPVRYIILTHGHGRGTTGPSSSRRFSSATNISSRWEGSDSRSITRLAKPPTT